MTSWTSNMIYSKWNTEEKKIRNKTNGCVWIWKQLWFLRVCIENGLMNFWPNIWYAQSERKWLLKLNHNLWWTESKLPYSWNWIEYINLDFGAVSSLSNKTESDYMGKSGDLDRNIHELTYLRLANDLKSVNIFNSELFETQLFHPDFIKSINRVRKRAWISLHEKNVEE